MSSTAKSILAAAILGLAGTQVAGAGDFDGFYAGLYGRNDFNRPPADLAVGAFAGYNFALSNAIVAGVEADVEYDWSTNRVPGGTTTFTGLANARLGFDTGSNFMVYGKAGAGFVTRGGLVWDFGAGVEARVAGDYLVRAEAERLMGAGLVAPRTNVKIGFGYSF